MSNREFEVLGWIVKQRATACRSGSVGSKVAGPMPRAPSRERKKPAASRGKPSNRMTVKESCEKTHRQAHACGAQVDVSTMGHRCVTATAARRADVLVARLGTPPERGMDGGGDDGTDSGRPTESPSACSRSSVRPPNPLTRAARSDASSNGPLSARSSRIARAFVGPMPLMLRKAASSATLTSTAA